MDGKRIAARIEKLVEEKGIKKIRLGEILGVAADRKKQQKYTRFSTFLKNLRKGKIVIEDLGKIAKIFDKPVEWFLFGATGLAQKTENYNATDLEKSIQTSGLSQDEINLFRKHIALLKRRKKK